MIKGLKKIEIKRKYIYLSYYGTKQIIKLNPDNTNLSISIKVDLPKPEAIKEFGK